MAAMHGRPMHYADDEYYDEEDASGDKHVNLGQMMEDNLSEGGDNQRYTNGRQLTGEEEEMILSELLYSAQDNREFMKVLHILQNDGELRPLIFEHEALLRTLKDVKELKAEQMLSILTAAETEMYESSKKNEELIQQQKMINKNKVPTEHKLVQVSLESSSEQTQKSQVEQLKKQVQALESENQKHKQKLQNREQQLQDEGKLVKRLRNELETSKSSNESAKHQHVQELMESISKLEALTKSQEKTIRTMAKQEAEFISTIETLERENTAIKRKISEYFQLFMIPTQDESVCFNNSTQLFRKSDFNFHSQEHARQQRGEEAELGISRPRRKSVDSTSFSIRNRDDLMASLNLKQKIFQNLRNVDKLQSEIQDLKLQNQFLQRKAPQERREEDTPEKNQLITFEKNEPGNMVEEIQYRLVQILRKLLSGSENADRFAKSKPCMDVVKELIFEISSKIDEFQIQLKQANRTSSPFNMFEQKNRAASQESNEVRSHMGRQESPDGAHSQYTSQPMLLNQRKKHYMTHASQEDISNFASTADITLILDEREKRLQAKEELVSCKEKMIGLQQENQRLRQEVSQERSQSFAMSHIEGYQQRSEHLDRHA